MASAHDDALVELYRRGALNDTQKQAFEELVRRGTITTPAAKQLVNARSDAKGYVGSAPQALRTFNQGATLGFADELNAGGAALMTGINNLGRKVTGQGDVGYGMRDAYDAVMAEEKQRNQQFQTDHPVANAALQIGGAVATPGGALAGRFITSGGKGLLNVAARSGMVGTAYGAASGIGSADGGFADRLQAGLNGGMAGGIVGAAVPVAARAASNAAQGLAPNLSAQAQMLVNHKVSLTPGQARGGVAKAMEDGSTSLPIAGQAIQGARRQGVESFNRAIANDALAHVGQSVPDTVATGHDLVAHVQDELTNRYKTLVPQGGVTLDSQLSQDLTNLAPDISTLTQANQDRLKTILQQRVEGRFGGGATLDGAGFQRVQSDLDYETSRFSGTQDPDTRAISNILGRTQRALDDAAARQNPQFATEKDALDTAYSKFKRFQSAAASKGAEEGVFTPAQYRSAILKADDSLDKGRFARGDMMNQDLAEAGQAVLPSKLGDSGTATRGMIGMLATAPGMIAGGGVGGGMGAAAGFGATLAGLGALGSRYSPQAIAGLNARLAKSPSQSFVDRLLTPDVQATLSRTLPISLSQATQR